jgi:hypothetical protein
MDISTIVILVILGVGIVWTIMIYNNTSSSSKRRCKK